MLVGKLEEKRLLGTPKCRWEGNIKMDLKRMCKSGFNWLRTGSNGRLL
jgi:hypothetical protein